MGFLKHLRSRSRIKLQEENNYPLSIQHSQQPRSSGRNLASRLPDNVYERIFGFVCPHALDHSYAASEHSAVGDGCMLCDMRDLASAARVSRKWYKSAQALLYHSVRIDAVHYCELEIILSEKRRHKSHRKTAADAVEDVPAKRLALFCRTVRESPQLGQLVELVKLPYMTRETSKGELAATVAALPNLRYVDLPDGIFNGDPSCMPLLNELQARCPDIRKMSYHHGAELQLESLSRQHWQQLEEIDINGIVVEPGMLRIILASLPTLHRLTLAGLEWLQDSIFESSPNLPDFPALHSLTLEHCPFVTAAGLKSYIKNPTSREVLDTLYLKATAVTVADLPTFVFDATNLTNLTIISTVSFTDTLPLRSAPMLSSISLQTLMYEIADDESHTPSMNRASASFYAYLARCLHANTLPALQTLYVRDPTFPELILLPLPPATPDGVPSSLNRPIEIFSKGLDEEEYLYTYITPSGNPSSSSDPGTPSNGVSIPHSFTAMGGRPLSAYNASKGLGPQWGPQHADSVMVGNGFGGFLAVPKDDPSLPRPRSNQAERQTLLAAAFSAPNNGSRTGSPLSMRGGSEWAAATSGNAFNHQHHPHHHHVSGGYFPGTVVPITGSPALSMRSGTGGSGGAWHNSPALGGAPGMMGGGGGVGVNGLTAGFGGMTMGGGLGVRPTMGSRSHSANSVKSSVYYGSAFGSPALSQSAYGSAVASPTPSARLGLAGKVGLTGAKRERIDLWR